MNGRESLTVTAARATVAVLGVAFVLEMAFRPPSVVAARALLTVSVNILGTVVVIALALLALQATVEVLIRDWRAATFYACGVVDHLGRPCYLPVNHRDHEHATQWQDMVGDGSNNKQARHRYDDTTQEGRLEWRHRPTHLPRVTAGGDPADTVGTTVAQ